LGVSLHHQHRPDPKDLYSDKGFRHRQGIYRLWDSLCVSVSLEGAELYLQVFCWDSDWHIFATNNGIADTVDIIPGRIAFSLLVHQAAGLLSALSVGGTFIYLYRLLR